MITPIGTHSNLKKIDKTHPVSLKFNFSYSQRSEAMSDQNSKTDTMTPKLCYWRRWEGQFGEPKTGALKYALLNRKENGFNRCTRIINNKIYLDVEETFKYFNSCKEV